MTIDQFKLILEEIYENKIDEMKQIALAVYYSIAGAFEPEVLKDFLENSGKKKEEEKEASLEELARFGIKFAKGD